MNTLALIVLQASLGIRKRGFLEESRPSENDPAQKKGDAWRTSALRNNRMGLCYLVGAFTKMSTTVLKVRRELVCRMPEWLKMASTPKGEH